MNVSLDQFAIEVARITDAGELVDYVVRVFREGFGVSLFNFGIYGKLDHFARFTDHPTGVASVMPVEWAERYLAEDHFSRDRAFAHLQFGNGSRCWTSFREEEGGDVVMQEVTAFGLSHGLAIPLFGSGYVKAGIMIGGDKLIEAADVRPILEAMAVIFHARFDQIGRQVERPALSALQLEILKWMGQGKSKSVIAEIMSMSDANVDYHVRQIFKKLGASSALSAVLQAMMLGLISPDLDLVVEPTRLRSR